MRPEKRGTQQVPSLPSAADAALIVLTTIGFYAFLMHPFPLIYGGDTIARLVHPSRIMNGHQLPLLQALIYLVLRVHYGPASVFLLMALISGAACAGVYALVCVLTGDRRSSLLAAALYGTHPFLLYYSRVPYQEPLLIAAITWGFYFLFRPAYKWNRFGAALCLAIACLTRYEGWIAAVVAAGFDYRQSRDTDARTNRLVQISKSAVTFGWAPALWVLWNGDLSPAGSYVLDLAFSLARFYRSYFIAKSTVWWTDSAVVLMSAIGFAYCWLAPSLRGDRRFHALIILVALLLLVLPFSGHGIEPDATRIVTEREAFIPVTILVLYAGLGTNLVISAICRIRPSGTRSQALVSILLVGFMAGYSLDRGLNRVASANADPELKTDYEIARYLAGKNARALIFAAPLSPELMHNYLMNVEKWSGPKGRRKAEQLLKEAETTPIDYQRVLTYSWLGSERVISGDQLKGLDRNGIEEFLKAKEVDCVIVFSDFVPASTHESVIPSDALWSQEPELEIRNGARIARIYPVRLNANRHPNR